MSGSLVPWHLLQREQGGGGAAPPLCFVRPRRVVSPVPAPFGTQGARFVRGRRPRNSPGHNSLAFGDGSEANLTRWQYNAFARVTPYYRTLTGYYGLPHWFVGSLWILGFACVLPLRGRARHLVLSGARRPCPVSRVHLGALLRVARADGLLLDLRTVAGFLPVLRTPSPWRCGRIWTCLHRRLAPATSFALLTCVAGGDSRHSPWPS